MCCGCDPCGGVPGRERAHPVHGTRWWRIPQYPATGPTERDREGQARKQVLPGAVLQVSLEVEKESLFVSVSITSFTSVCGKLAESAHSEGNCNYMSLHGHY